MLVKRGTVQKSLIYSCEWDVLVILDACRYDTFKDNVKMLGVDYELTRVTSLGSCTMEWFVNTFTKRIPRTVYVSGNPYIGNYSNTFKGKEYCPPRIFSVVKDAFIEGWRKINGVYTVDPEYIMKLSILMSMFFKGYRLIIHFLQPHAPYPLSPYLRKYFVNERTRPDFKLWEALKRGELNPEKVRKEYEKNLKWALTYVKRLIKSFKGKRIVITSDHGECFGEHGLYGHPCGVRVQELIDVPWCIIMV